MLKTTIKTIIVDDEKPSCDVLANYIRDYCPALEIVAVCKSVKTAYKAILENEPQLLFLDVEMPRGSGFDLLRKFNVVNFHVVFVTAFSSYAMEAFRVSATDFLMKPVKVSELIEAVNKVHKNIELRSSQNLSLLLKNIDTPAGQLKKLIVPNLKGFTAVNLSDIIMCEADGYCTNFSLVGKLRASSSYNLKYFEECLPAKDFLRVHNSYIINMNFVTGYSNQGVIILTEGLTCPLGAARKQAFFQFFRRIKTPDQNQQKSWQ